MNIILIAEDKPEEQTKAREAVMEIGAKPVIGGTLKDVNRLLEKLEGKIVGIITDIHFPESEECKNDAPCGIAVAIRALQKKISVGICSDINHHHAEYLKMIVSGLQNISGQKIPFTMDRKDWKKTLKEVIE